jgi:hypothetical protein
LRWMHVMLPMEAVMLPMEANISLWHANGMHGLASWGPTEEGETEQETERERGEARQI